LLLGRWCCSRWFSCCTFFSESWTGTGWQKIFLDQSENKSWRKWNAGTTKLFEVFEFLEIFSLTNSKTATFTLH
jgi:hypothetical protein